MGTSLKKKREKKADFTKPKLKVGKSRPKNTNATNTSFSAKSIVLKQQNLGVNKNTKSLFDRNLSLLSSKNETQRRDALQHLTTAVVASGKELPQPAPVIIAKAQPLILDGNGGVRQGLLKLFKSLSDDQVGSRDQILLYTRAGITHLSIDIRLSSLDVLDWLLDTQGGALLACSGGWIKTLRTFQNLLSWHDIATSQPIGTNGVAGQASWLSTKTTTGLGSPKLLVHQLNTLAHFLVVGLTRPSVDPQAPARRAAELFPLWHTDVHMLPTKSMPFSYLNLFGTPRDVESEIYGDAEERIKIFNELELPETFRRGVKEAKKEGGEVGRAAALVDSALTLAKAG